MFDRLFALDTFGIKLGLENIGRITAALDHPERSFPTLHVAGTNGKGSVTAMVHTALLAAGFRAARYTSPHLVDLEERFVIGSDPVETTALAEVTNVVLDLVDRLLARRALPGPPTFFEATTAIAFELFRRAGVDVAVIEVGLGGRFDATNVIDPVAGAITSIAFDHQQHLGSSLEMIAFEKAGIIKPGMPVVTGRLPPEATAVVERIAAERNAAIIPATDDTAIQSEMRGGQAHLVLTTPHERYGPLTLSLRGGHQIGNAAVAVRLLESANRCGIATGKDAIEHGLTATRWPGRLELLVLHDGRRLLLDAAHNVEGAGALAAYLAEWHAERPPIVLGVMSDKDVEGIVRALLPVTSTFIVTAARIRRAMDPAELAARISTLDPSRVVHTEPEPAAAVERAFHEGNCVCAAGSIFLVGAVREAFRGRAILH